jgi:hypothetical protein
MISLLNQKIKLHLQTNHKYHLVDPSPWPIFGSLGGFCLTIGGVLYMHKKTRYFSTGFSSNIKIYSLVELRQLNFKQFRSLADQNNIEIYRNKSYEFHLDVLHRYFVSLKFFKRCGLPSFSRYRKREMWAFHGSFLFLKFVQSSEGQKLLNDYYSIYPAVGKQQKFYEYKYSSDFIGSSGDYVSNTSSDYTKAAISDTYIVLPANLAVVAAVLCGEYPELRDKIFENSLIFDEYLSVMDPQKFLLSVI